MTPNEIIRTIISAIIGVMATAFGVVNLLAHRSWLALLIVVFGVWVLYGTLRHNLIDLNNRRGNA